MVSFKWKMYMMLHSLMPRTADKIKNVMKKRMNNSPSTYENSILEISEYVKNHPKIQNKEEYKKTYCKEMTPINLNKINIAFIVPQPIEGSGGHRNIFRAIKYLHSFGHSLTVYYTQTIEKSNVIKNNVNKWFYDMEDIPFIAYDGTTAKHDVIVATWWETAYMVDSNKKQSDYHFYYVQDYEPAFYPMCSNYILSENTYKLGFSHICSGKWCKEKLIKKYNAEAEYFQFPVNKEIYNTNESRTKTNKNIIFFAKPEMDRRCFEIGIRSLKIISERRPDIEIILFGSSNIDETKITFKATILGILPTIYDLAQIYRNADLGIVFSTTNPSLVPYEMLSCGCPVVDFNLEDSNTKYGDSYDRAFLFSTQPERLSEEILDIIDNKKLLKERADNGKKWVDAEFPSEYEMAKRIERMIIKKITTGRIEL